MFDAIGWVGCQGFFFLARGVLTWIRAPSLAPSHRGCGCTSAGRGGGEGRAPQRALGTRHSRGRSAAGRTRPLPRVPADARGALARGRPADRRICGRVFARAGRGCGRGPRGCNTMAMAADQGASGGERGTHAPWWRARRPARRGAAPEQLRPSPRRSSRRHGTVHQPHGEAVDAVAGLA